MAQTFDLILRGGTVVNHDGEGARDLGGDGRPDRGDRRPVAGVRRRDGRLPRPARPAGRDRHPGAFPRARRDPQGGPGNRLARRRHGRRHGGVRDAEHQSDHHQRGGAGRQGPARPSPHALRFRLLHGRHAREHPRPARARTAARLRRRQGVHGLVDRLAAGRGRRGRAQHPQGDPAARLVPFRGRIPAQRAQGPAASRAIRARIRSGATRSRRCDARSAWSRLARETGKRVHVLHISTAQEMDVPQGPQGRRLGRGDAASSHAGSAGLLRAARHAARR